MWRMLEKITKERRRGLKREQCRVKERCKCFLREKFESLKPKKIETSVQGLREKEGRGDC